MSAAVDRRDGVVADEVMGLVGVGRATEAAGLAERELGRRSGAGVAPRLLEAWAAASLATGRHCVDIRDVVGGAYYDHAATGDAVGAGTAATIRGRLELAVGRAGSAARWTQRAIRVLAGVDDVMSGGGAPALRMAYAVRTQAEALFGVDVSPALDRVSAAEGMPGARAHERTELLLATAWGLAARGEPVRGSEILLGAVRDCGDRLAEEAAVLHAALRLGAPPARVAGRLTELATLVDGPMAKLFAQRAEGLVAEDGFLLDVTASAFDALGLDLLAAETWAEATAAYRAQRGRTSSAALTLSNARMALGRCEGATTHVLAAVLHDRPWSTAGQAVTSGGRPSRPRCGAR